jgi:AhpD family alkylhydroperoxidase
MRRILFASVVCFASAPVAAQQAPEFFKNTYPEHALEALMAVRAALEGEEAALDAKTRELIGLGVSAQIPCTFCVYAHLKSARAAGASEQEIREAVATAAAVRHNSTVLNGMNYDLSAFKAEVDGVEAAATR